MRVPLQWLAELVDGLPAVDVLAERLTMAGLEVEEIDAPDPRMVEGLVTARIVDMHAHPNADRLTLCTIDDGEGRRSVVCGAKNMSAGDVVVLARPGTVLPGGLQIKKSKIRGQESLGMLCSAAELGADGDSDGIMLLDPATEPGAPAAALLGLDQTVLELGITPNRGDCLSMRGIAREVSALCGCSTTDAFGREHRLPDEPSPFVVSIEAKRACAMYRGLELRGVRVGPSPAWLMARLAAVGLRPINNVVDVTNYVLMEYGQPLHAFDADLLSGDTIHVRIIEDAFEVETLDAFTRELQRGDLAIWDADGPVAIAGVMGGARTAVHDGTSRIFLESAFFDPRAVRMTSRRLGLVSDSSYRFERGVDPCMVEQALVRAAELICEVAGATISGGIARAGDAPPAATSSTVRHRRVELLLGRAVEAHRIVAHLSALGASVETCDGGVRVTAPTHRYDLDREVDWIEEIARLEGYDSFFERAPVLAMQAARVPPVRAAQRRAAAALIAGGMSEAIALAFCSPLHNQRFAGLHDATTRSVRLRNPLRSDEGELRRSLLPGLLAAHGLNVRGGSATTDLFTLGRTFGRTEADEVVEIDALAGVLSGPRRGRGPGSVGDATFFDAKGNVERALRAVAPSVRPEWSVATGRAALHPRRCADIVVGGEVVGYVGALHPDLADALEARADACVFEVDSKKVLQYAPPRSELRPVPRFPASSRDVSFLVPVALLAGTVVAAVKQMDEPLIEDVRVFDEYVGEGLPEGRKALAFSFLYRSAERTLTDEDVSALHDRVVGRLTKRLDIAVRA